MESLFYAVSLCHLIMFAASWLAILTHWVLCFSYLWVTLTRARPNSGTVLIVVLYPFDTVNRFIDVACTRTVLESSLHAVPIVHLIMFAASYVVIPTYWALSLSCLRVTLGQGRPNGGTIKIVVWYPFDIVFGFVDVPWPGIPWPKSLSLSHSHSREARREIVLLSKGPLIMKGGVLQSMPHFDGMLGVQKYM